jgi:hypothetical protein
MKKKIEPKDIIDQIYRQYHSLLLAEVEKANTLIHLGRIYDSGSALEIALKKLLWQILPNYVGLTRGFVIDESFT